MALDKLVLFQSSAKREKGVRKEMMPLISQRRGSLSLALSSQINFHIEFTVCVSFKLNSAFPSPSPSPSTHM